MHMIGHQHVTVDGDALLARCDLQRLQVSSEVLVVDEGRPAVHPAMGDVLGNAGQFEAWAAHDPTMLAVPGEGSRLFARQGVREHFQPTR